MIISVGRRYIFVHAPKTGGTALALALEARAMKDDILVGDTPKAVQRRERAKGLPTAQPLTKHSMLAELDGYLDATDLQGFFVFMLVRNPWDRMVSYYHWLRDQSFEHPAVKLSKALEFSEFVANRFLQQSFQASAYGRYVRDAAGRERCDLFIRLEHLAEDLAPLESHLGFPLDDIPHANRSQRRADYRAYYTDATREMVARTCAADIARFGYSFEG
jgi:hypothetical protein